MIKGSRRWLGAGLLLWLAAGCGEAALPASDHEGLAQVVSEEEAARASEADRAPTGLARAATCTDLLARVQDDAIAKVRQQLDEARQRRVTGRAATPVPPTPTARPPTAPAPGRLGGLGGLSGGARGEAADADAPVGASDTNRQVEGVDEADFVKVVNDGRAIFLLHGSTLRRLKSWPPEVTSLEGKALLIEGRPQEMFVTEQGRAVVFSTVEGYAGRTGRYGTALKLTVVDVSGPDSRLERELYVEGSYVSSRRYATQQADVVRVVARSSLKYGGAFLPSIEYTDPWGRAYDTQEIEAQLAEWERRTIAAIRDTDLSHWLPDTFEVQDGKLTRLPPACDAYFVPPPGVADFGLTHVLTLDVARAGQPVSGATVVGASSTVYSSGARLVLAQPDTRWQRYGGPSREQTALHVFDLAGADTRYTASGWVPGRLPPHNPQLGLDVAVDGTIRMATTGSLRTRKQDASGREVWDYRVENQVITVRAADGQLAVTGTTGRLGKEGESMQSARFVGDRAYVVTYRNVDPLIVVDVAGAPRVLGEIEIPGFGQYMHPLDQDHLITVGRSALGGMQLSLFDVSDPRSIPAPKVLDLGRSTRSAVSYDHKAFTLYDGVLAIPVSGYAQRGSRRAYFATLALVRVDAEAGFTDLGEVDHASLYADNSAGVLCGFCDATGCFDYSCPYEPEVRRGHFVKGQETTYVYSFSHAGVLVNDLTSLAKPVGTVGLPAPIASSGPWYELPAEMVPTQSVGATDDDVDVDGGFTDEAVNVPVLGARPPLAAPASAP